MGNPDTKQEKLPQRRPGWTDYAALLVLKLARRRRKLIADRFYETFFEDYHVEQYEKDLRMILKHREIVNAFAPLHEMQTWVDLGCGVGHILKRFPPNRLRIGLDFSLPSLRIAQQHVKTEVSLVRASAFHLPLASARVDVLTCFEVLEHLADDGAVLQEIARVVRPGGWLMVSVPNTYYFAEYARLMGHLRHYTRATLEALLQAYGFSIVQTLNMFPTTNRRYAPVYLVLEAGNMILNRLLKPRQTIYARHVPFSSALFYDTLILPMFLKWAEQERNRSGISLAESTFLVARRTP